MITALHVITLYIHPEKGPITPMRLDMMDVEVAAIRSPVGANRDDVRAREIAARIKKEFKDVDPHSKLGEIRTLVGKLSHTYLFNGIALCLPGTIDGKSVPNPTVEEFQRLTQEILELKKQLEEQRRKHDAVSARLHHLESENKRLVNKYNEANSEVTGLQVHLQEAEEQVKNARTEAKRAKDKSERLEQENAALQTELDLAKRDKQTFQAMQTELSSLRQSLTQANKAEQQLRETLARRENEINALRDRIGRITGDLRHDTADEDGNPFGDM